MRSCSAASAVCGTVRFRLGQSKARQRFRRGSVGEPDAPGLGLGLAIVKSIVERHDGSILAERTAAGRTRFTMTLPLEEEE